jgi:adenylate cyclase
VSDNTEQRKLAAIMFTDMVGYSALSQRDDKLALELLEEHRQLLREILPRFHGTEIKTIGDAFLVEFNSALEAAQCAIEIQRTLAKRNHDVTAERRIELKIGIHIGDVVHRGGDVYGDGVNIASRIEPLAGAGGICVSMDVERQIRNAVETRFEKLAPTELKNISLPMDLFRIVLPWEQRSAGVTKPEAGSWPSGRKFATAGIALLLLSLIGIAWWWTTQSRRASPSPAAPSAVHAADQKSIAVLPFVDMSQAKDQEYFCDGISEEILDALAKVEGLRVVARTSSFSFKGKNADVGEIAQKLNVRNVLEGSLRREGSRIRISAQLIDTRDGFHLWSETYERELQELFAMQDEITRAIVNALKIKLAVAVPVHKQPNTQAYDLYLKGRYFLNKKTGADTTRAIDYFQQALAKDPNDALAYAGLSDCYSSLTFPLGAAAPREAMPKAKEAALHALAIDNALGEGHASLAYLTFFYDWDWPAAEKEFKRAIELNPNNADAHHWYSHYLMGQGRIEESLTQSTRALELSPYDILFNVHLAWHYLYARQYDRALDQIEKTIEMDENFAQSYPWLGLILEQQGKYAEAIAAFQKAISLFPGGSSIAQAELAHTYALSGNREAAQKIIAELQELAKKRYVSSFQIAAIHAGLGEKDQAFAWLEKAYEERSDGLVNLRADQRFDSLRSDPRYKDLARRVGLVAKN